MLRVRHVFSYQNSVVSRKRVLIHQATRFGTRTDTVRRLGNAVLNSVCYDVTEQEVLHGFNRQHFPMQVSHTEQHFKK